MKIKLNFKKRKEIIAKLNFGEQSLFSLAKGYRVSRTLLYRLRKRYRQSENLLRPGARKKRKSSVSVDLESQIIDLVLTYPELSSHKLTELVRGKLRIGAHGVYNLLKRFGLNTYRARQDLASKYQERNQNPVNNRGFLYHEKK